ncbi:hypothetical protein DPMN_190534 [Dreissena polymorpha]|uniref:Uncharacterized protein n=1 Tax=Dreissena polymorpha TaxID=45954 RepID=A0A9D4DWE0_DREPO|nr:hypothetical protein DPMN_190534 [Dreissena polymorpha]
MAQHWSKSKFALVISCLKVNKYDANQAIESSLRIIKNLCKFCSIFNGYKHCYSMEDTVDIAKHEKYHQLKSDIPRENPKTTKQKTETWYKITNRSSVTGSTCYTALG